MMRIMFKCPKCESTRLEEVMGNVTVASSLLGIAEDGYVEYAVQSNDGGVVERYQCMACGHAIACTTEDAFGWLKKHGMLKKWN